MVPAGRYEADCERPGGVDEITGIASASSGARFDLHFRDETGCEQKYVSYDPLPQKRTGTVPDDLPNLCSVSFVTTYSGARVRKRRAGRALKHGAIEVMLSLAPRSQRASNSALYFPHADAGTLRELLRAQGYDAGELHRTVYGTDEFTLYDPDGTMLIFGSRAD
jgi:hypothetical protein